MLHTSTFSSQAHFFRIFALYFLFDAAFTPCSDFHQKIECYDNENCFWHTKNSLCEELSSYKEQIYEDCSRHESIHECYGEATCFWHHKTSKCERLSDYAPHDNAQYAQTPSTETETATETETEENATDYYYEEQTETADPAETQEPVESEEPEPTVDEESTTQDLETEEPTLEPTPEPTLQPTKEPTSEPTSDPTSEPGHTTEDPEPQPENYNHVKDECQSLKSVDACVNHHSCVWRVIGNGGRCKKGAGAGQPNDGYVAPPGYEPPQLVTEDIPTRYPTYHYNPRPRPHYPYHHNPSPHSHQSHPPHTSHHSEPTPTHHRIPLKERDCDNQMKKQMCLTSKFEGLPCAWIQGVCEIQDCEDFEKKQDCEKYKKTCMWDDADLQCDYAALLAETHSQTQTSSSNTLVVAALTFSITFFLFLILYHCFTGRKNSTERTEAPAKSLHVTLM